MAVINGLVPARFLTIIAHLILVIVIFWSRDDNVQACLPRNYTEDDYKTKDTQLIIGLSVSLGLFLLELIGFMGGMSMFMPSQGLISIAAHAGASVSLAYFIMDSWDCDHFWFIFGFSTAAHASAAVSLVLFIFDQWGCDWFWYIFGFCSAFPALTEIMTLIGVGALKQATAAHASAAVTLTFFLFDQWSCDNFWYVFGFCSALPAITEIIVLVGICAFKRGI